MREWGSANGLGKLLPPEAVLSSLDSLRSLGVTRVVPHPRIPASSDHFFPNPSMYITRLFTCASLSTPRNEGMPGSKPFTMSAPGSRMD